MRSFTKWLQFFRSLIISRAVRSHFHFLLCEILSHVIHECLCLPPSAPCPLHVTVGYNAFWKSLISQSHYMTKHVNLFFLSCRPMFPSVPTPSGLSHCESCFVWSSPLSFLASSMSVFPIRITPHTSCHRLDYSLLQIFI